MKRVTTVELLIVIGVVLFLMGAGISMLPNERYVRYDCRLVDVSPDFPEDAKRICRSRR